jgi:uncharacterized protein (DUF1919 family)
MSITYISNNCGNLSFFFKEKREYDHPFIGCLFVNDEQYIKFCINFDYYINLSPRIGIPNENSVWAKQSGNKWYQHKEIIPPYPVIYLGDDNDEIEIHFIHESSNIELLEKYNRRLERYKLNKPNIIFMLSCADLCNNHSNENRQKLIREFTSINNNILNHKTSIYLSRYKEDISIHPNVFHVELWNDCSYDRNSSFIPEIHFVCDRIDEYRKNMGKL